MPTKLATALFLFGAALLSVSAGGAEPAAVVTGRNVAVRAQPAKNAEILLRLEKGKKVRVLSEKGGWVKVRVALDRTFSFDGWMSRDYLEIRRPPKAKAKRAPSPPRPAPEAKRVIPAPPGPAAARTPAPAGQASSSGTTAGEAVAPPSDLDQLFEPSAATATPLPAPSPAPRAAEATSFRPAPPSRPAVSPPQEASAAERVRRGGDRGGVSLSAAYLLRNYKLSTGGSAPRKLFSVNLPGVGIDLGAEYWFFDGAGGRARLGAEGSFAYGLYRNDTGLKAAGETFATVKSKHSAYGGAVRILSEYRPRPGARAPTVGANLGFSYSRFDAGDVDGDAGPLGLYVSSRAMSLIAGARGSLPLAFVSKDLLLRLGLDLLPLNWVSESPGGSTGADPKGRLGFAPEVLLSWLPSERHRVSAGYRLRLEGYRATGTATRVQTEVTDGKVDFTQHFFYGGYRYAF